ncbi:MAG: hypothetical protein HFG73_04650 [Hungatella sp.]|nr:hypothetical protein [Hungatella sp.]
MYCPKCDVEFIDGITVCTDCGGPLAESEEAAKAMKEKEQRELLLKQQEYLSKLNQQLEEMQAQDGDSVPEAPSIPLPAGVYETKAQKYDDLKSSASAFLAVGGLLLAASIACWMGIIRLPMAGTSKLIFQGAMTAMGIFAMFIYVNTSRSAKKLRPEIDKEKHETQELVDWFTDSWKAADIDGKIEDREALSEEEMSLRRFQIIQDLLITGKDLPDPAYVDALCEEIYSKVFES